MSLQSDDLLVIPNSSGADQVRGRRIVGYVVKAFPRLSETFILNEVLAREAAGEQIEIASLRAPTDSRFHGDLGRLKASITWIPEHVRSAERVWSILGAGLEELDCLADGQSDVLPELLASPVGDAVQAIEVARWARDHRVAHLHAHFATAAANVARLASQLIGVPYSFTAHAKDIFHESVDADALGVLLRDAHHVVTVSDYNLADLRRRFGRDAERIHRVYNGVDTQRLMRPVVPVSPAFIAEGEHPRSVVSVGRLVAKKGFTHLIESAGLLRQSGIRVPFLIGGTGELKGDLEQQIADAALTGDVRMLGALGQDRVHSLIRSGTVFAAPFVIAENGDREGLPTVVLEAMAIGTPVVTTPVTGVPEAVIDGRTGLIVPEGDPVALGEAIAALLADGELRARLAHDARAHVERHFTLGRQAAELGRLCGGRAPRADRAPHLDRATDAVGTDDAVGAGSVVAYVCADPGVPVFGNKGASVHVRSILTEMVRRGCEVHLFAARWGGPIPPELTHVVCHELPRPQGDTHLREQAMITADGVLVEQLAALGEIDLLYQRYSLLSCEALELARARGWRSVLEMNAPLVEEQSRYRRLHAEQTALDRTVRAIRAASVAFGVSSGVAGWASDLSGVEVPVVPNGVDPSRFSSVGGVGSEEGGYHDTGGIVAGFVGTFRPWHDVESVVTALAAANDSIRGLRAATGQDPTGQDPTGQNPNGQDPLVPDVRLLLVGDGPGLVPAIDRAGQLGLEVEATGSVSAEDVPGLLERMDIGLAVYPPGDHYFSPLKVFEYLAAGLPVIASRVGGIERVFDNGREILLTDPGDYAGVATRIQRLCQSADLRRRLGEAGRDAIVRRFTWAHVLDEVLGLVGVADPAPGDPRANLLALSAVAP